MLLLATHVTLVREVLLFPKPVRPRSFRPVRPARPLLSEPGSRSSAGAGPGSLIFRRRTLRPMLEHLWNGWRMAYVTGSTAARPDATSAASVFTQILESGLSDEDAHIVHRGPLCFVIMNAFPYTSGHLMVLPYR